MTEPTKPLRICIRPSTDVDMPAVADIYAHYVLHSTATFETTVPTLQHMRERRAEVLSRGLPWLVLCQGDAVIGYAYCNWFKPREAYCYSAENAIYLHPDHTGHGHGRALLAELCAQAQAAGIRQLLAVIGGSDNVGSMGLHRACGYADAGAFKACGYKHGRWLDAVFMQKTLGAGDGLPPV